jgi:triacylglycerol lipase
MGTERNWQPPMPPSAAKDAAASTPPDPATTAKPTVPDFGAQLAADHGFVPFYVRYNSGQAIADSGVQLATLLNQLCDCYPVPITELLLVGHSMGGLVIRAACHQAAMEQSAWLRIPMRAAYIGTPHRGAPFERLGRVTTNVLAAINDPVTRLLASIAGLRSAGIQDLGDADVRHEDRARRQAQLSLRDPRHPVPLLASMQHLLIAGAISDKAWLTALFGDSIVPLASARNDGGIDPCNVVTIAGITHMQMLHDPRVYNALTNWLQPSPEPLP